MTKNVFGGTGFDDKKELESRPDTKLNIESSSKSVKPLNEVLKGLRNINGKKPDIEVSVNQSAGEGVLIVLLDTSSSMSGRFETSTKIMTANNVVNTQLLPNILNWKFGIIKFGSIATWYIAPENPKKGLMINTTAIGGTSMMAGLRMSWDWILRQDKGCRIILISDGEPTDASKQVILEAAIMNRNVPIDTVGVGENRLYSGYDPAFLRELSRITGGVFCEAHTVKMLSQTIFKLSPKERPLLGVERKEMIECRPCFKIPFNENLCPNIAFCQAREPLDCRCYGCEGLDCLKCLYWDKYDKGS